MANLLMKVAASISRVFVVEGQEFVTSQGDLPTEANLMGQDTQLSVWFGHGLDMEHAKNTYWRAARLAPLTFLAGNISPIIEGPISISAL